MNAASQMFGITNRDFNEFSCSIVSMHSVVSPNSSFYYIWILDSGATNYITCHKELLHDMQPLTGELFFPDGKTASIAHVASLHFVGFLVIKHSENHKFKS